MPELLRLDAGALGPEGSRADGDVDDAAGLERMGTSAEKDANAGRPDEGLGDSGADMALANGDR